MPWQILNDPIGEIIYKRIKEYDITSLKVFFKTISAEHKELYENSILIWEGK
jgi:hypothetical protein